MQGEAATLMFCKHKVAPLKAISIPRLELLAAELVIDLTKLTTMVFNLPKDQYWYWSDSTNVLSWLKMDSRSLHEFVGNRVALILDATKASHWRWVKTTENPADIPSRGAVASKLRDNELWWHGPKFITQAKEQWPQQPTSLTIPEEASREVWLL